MEMPGKKTVSRSARRRRLLAVLIVLSVASLVAPVWADAIAQPDTAITAWSAASATEIDRETLEKTILAADYLIIGEIHDNPHHHRLQAELTARFADGHGGGLPESMLPAMVDVQIARDAFMAYRMSQAAERGVIITDFALLTSAHPREDPCLAFQ